MNLTGKKILVTGGTGYIGSHTCVQLLSLGANVVIIDNLCNSSIDTLQYIEKISERKLTNFYKVDLCNEKKLEQVFKKEQTFDACIHFAGLKAVGESVQNPLDYYQNNLISTLFLIQQLKNINCKNFIFSSSATVYGESDQMPLVETAPLTATNPYGRTKLMIEKILKDIANSDKSWKFVILRYFNPIGAHPSGLIGENPTGIPNNLMPFITQVAIGKLKEIKVFGDTYDTIDGTGIRDYIHVVDLANGHCSALTNGVFGKMESNYEAFNLGTGVGTSVLELISQVEKSCGFDIKFSIVGKRKGDVAICYANPNKAKRVLHWETNLTTQDGADHSWKWQTSQQDK